MNKEKLRNCMLNTRAKLSSIEIQKKSQQINSRLFSFSPYQKAKVIVFYLSIKNEPNTTPLIKKAWQQNKQVLIPVTQVTNKSLTLSQLKSFTELTPGPYNIPEPQQKYLRPTKPLTADLCIIPGLAFDHNGYRIGYGGGYIDRFLPTLHPDCLKIALAYDFQILDSMPKEKHDIPIDLIITETTIHFCNQELAP